MSEVTERIARMIENDGNAAIKRVLRVAQSDVMALLCEFMDVRKLDMTVDGANDGYTLKITANVARFFDIGKTSEIE